VSKVTLYFEKTIQFIKKSAKKPGGGLQVSPIYVLNYLSEDVSKSLSLTDLVTDELVPGAESAIVAVDGHTDTEGEAGHREERPPRLRCQSLRIDKDVIVDAEFVTGIDPILQGGE